MLTITISLRALLIALAVALCAIAAVFATDALAGDDTQLQGDVNCDQGVDNADILAQLLHEAELDVTQSEPCTDIEDAFPLGTSIVGPPGPSGAPGPTGPPGPSGAPGLNFFAVVRADGTLIGGSAVDARKLSDGEYAVQFPVNVLDCGAAATVGSKPSISYKQNVFVSVVPSGFGGILDDDEIQVSMYDPDSDSALDNAFHLIVAC